MTRICVRAVVDVPEGIGPDGLPALFAHADQVLWASAQPYTDQFREHGADPTSWSNDDPSRPAETPQLTDDDINSRAVWHPADTPDARPAIEIAGVLVSAYVDNLRLCVAVDLETAAEALLVEDRVPLRVDIGAHTVYEHD